ncbi:MAG: hypothetical protein KBC84_06685 [Proteobacteria bacterium]|nr:hypothetical protein [Pseudomonadota bacterium]
MVDATPPEGTGILPRLPLNTVDVNNLYLSVFMQSKQEPSSFLGMRVEPEPFDSNMTLGAVLAAPQRRPEIESNERIWGDGVSNLKTWAKENRADGIPYPSSELAKLILLFPGRRKELGKELRLAKVAIEEDLKSTDPIDWSITSRALFDKRVLFPEEVAEADLDSFWKKIDKAKVVEEVTRDRIDYSNPDSEFVNPFHFVFLRDLSILMAVFGERAESIGAVNDPLRQRIRQAFETSLANSRKHNTWNDLGNAIFDYDVLLNGTRLNQNGQLQQTT